MLVVISLEALKGYRSEEWMVIVVGEAGELTILGVDNFLSLYLPFHSFEINLRVLARGTVSSILFIFASSPPLCSYVESFLC